MYASYSLKSRKVEHTLWDPIYEFTIQKLNPLVAVDLRFISAFLHA